MRKRNGFGHDVPFGTCWRVDHLHRRRRFGFVDPGRLQLPRQQVIERLVILHIALFADVFQSRAGKLLLRQHGAVGTLLQLRQLRTQSRQLRAQAHDVWVLLRRGGQLRAKLHLVAGDVGLDVGFLTDDGLRLSAQLQDAGILLRQPSTRDSRHPPGDLFLRQAAVGRTGAAEPAAAMRQPVVLPKQLVGVAIDQRRRKLRPGPCLPP